MVIKVQTEDLDELAAFVYDLFKYSIFQRTTYIVKEKFHIVNKERTKKAALLFVRVALPYEQIDLIDAISKVDYVDEVSAVFGNQDIIIDINEKAAGKGIYPKVIEKIRSLRNIGSTETLVTIDQ